MVLRILYLRSCGKALARLLRDEDRVEPSDLAEPMEVRVL